MIRIALGFVFKKGLCVSNFAVGTAQVGKTIFEYVTMVTNLFVAHDMG